MNIVIENDAAPLLGDPKRDASGSLRGYSYQMLRSIEVWLDLAAGETLVLEGAEDLDRVGPDRALVEQVKDTAGSSSVMLRSAGVQEAIGNFWLHLRRNPGRTIRFRFLPTSEVGREQNRPLGFDQPGLEAWRSIQEAPSTADSAMRAAAILDFLKGTAEPAGHAPRLVGCVRHG